MLGAKLRASAGEPHWFLNHSSIIIYLPNNDYIESEM